MAEQKHYSDAEVSAVQQLLNEDLTEREIAEKMGRSRAGIVGLVRRKGLVVRGRRLYNSQVVALALRYLQMGNTLKEIAEEFAMNHLALQRAIERECGQMPAFANQDQYRRRMTYDPTHPASAVCQNIEHGCNGRGCYMAHRCQVAIEYNNRR